MGHRFPLATLLRMREIAEQREERLLSHALRQVRQAYESLALLDVHYAATLRQRDSELQLEIAAASLQMANAKLQTIEDMRQATRREIAAAELRRDEQMKTYQAAHRNHELLDKMRLDQRDEFLAERDRQEQKMVDDTFASRGKKR